MKRYITTLQREFSKYGFTECPLTTDQMTALYKNNIKLEEAYMIGCDVSSGFRFDVAYDANLAEEDTA